MSLKKGVKMSDKIEDKLNKKVDKVKMDILDLIEDKIEIAKQLNQHSKNVKEYSEAIKNLMDSLRV